MFTIILIHHKNQNLILNFPMTLVKSVFVFLWISFLATFYYSTTFAQKSQSTIKTDYCHFEGTINGNLPIVMDLIQNGNSYEGTYYYEKYNSPINLEGKVNAKGEIELFTMDAEGEKIEFITGNINKNTFIGSWNNKDKTKTLPISVVENYSKSVVFSFIAIKDSVKLFKNKKETPQATFSDMIVEVKQVPEGGNLSKIKEVLKKYQSNLVSGYSEGVKTKVNNVEENKKVFFEEYLEANKDLEEEYFYSANWNNQSSIEVVFNNNYFATLSFSNYQYTGGAHGISGKSYLAIDIKNGKEIKLNDIFDRNSLATLEKRMIKKAHAYTGFANSTSLKDAGYLVDKIEITDNFSLTAKGITFVYQPYQIAPYAAGLPSFLFTWEELKDLVKMDSPVRSLLKKQ